MHIKRGRKATAVTAAGAMLFALLTVSATPAGASVPTVSGDVQPVASYDFDNDSGSTVVDSSGHGNNATWTGTPGYASGISGKAMQFYRGTRIVTLPSNVKPGSTGVSVQFWLYETEASQDGAFFGNEDWRSGSGPYGGLLLYNLNGTTQLSALIGGNSARLTNLDNIKGKWVYIGAVVDSTAKTLKVYENGAQVGSTLKYTTTNPLDGGLPFRIGTDGRGVTLTGDYPDAWASGLVDDFNIYDQPISSTQIANDYAATNPANYHSITVTSGGHGSASADFAATGPGTKVSLTQNATTGYHFAGWQVQSPSGLTISSDNTFAMPTTDVSVRATFDPNVYTVHFVGNGADGGSTPDQKIGYDQSTPLTANSYTRTGAGFVGWATSPTGPVVYRDGESVSNLAVADGATVTLYARWRGTGQHLVSFGTGAHGTATASADSVTPGGTVTLTPAPTTGYHLAGWQVETPAGLTVNANNTFTMPAADVTLTPQFAPNTYTVHYDGNGADGGTTDDSSFSYDHAAALAPNGSAREHFRFAGWSTTATGPVVYEDMATVNNLTAEQGGTVTLYAQWTKLSVQPGSWSSLPAGFVTDTFHLPSVPVTAAISQPLVGLWNGAAPTQFSKVSGDEWLSVSADGTVRGTAPGTVPQHAGEITVSATNGTTTSRILVEVPVVALHAAPRIQTASWNAWDNGRRVTDAAGKNLAVIASQGIGVVGFQDGGYAMAQSVGTALGWQVHGAGDLGIVSSYPFTTAKRVYPTNSTPAAAATISVDGNPIHVWDVHLNESDYGPYNACFDGATAPGTLISHEKSTTRYAQAQAVAQAMKDDLKRSVPVILLGDLASPSGADWTAATSGSHCDAGAVDWPVPDVFTKAGLADSFRVANTDPAANPGNTWSPVTPTNGNGQPEPQDRIDYVHYTRGALHVEEAHTLTVGWPSATNVARNAWASDHAAAVTTFAVGGKTTGPTPAKAPTVTVNRHTIAYQVGQGPADDAAFLNDVGAGTNPGNATLAVDLSQVDFTAEGWYTALITSTRKGMISDPVTIAVQVEPAP
ncbi:InlB B-repeat-containing protein [Sphaerisporangium sp. NPDC051011]|uniref:InlB B-repeat-containing protein n=1 Tax=Sphaerisporangium sp. NPDC051011 TaxID=3155792 RepID=UPI0033FA2213